MKIRVVSKDGTAMNTHVINAETGEELRGVTCIDFDPLIDGGVATCRLTFNFVGLDCVSVVAGVAHVYEDRPWWRRVLGLKPRGHTYKAVLR